MTDVAKVIHARAAWLSEHEVIELRLVRDYGQAALLFDLTDGAVEEFFETLEGARADARGYKMVDEWSRRLGHAGTPRQANTWTLLRLVDPIDRTSGGGFGRHLIPSDAAARKGPSR